MDCYEACVDRYPDHSITDDVWWYYMLELSFYWSLMLSQFFDVQRSDFWEMFAHHVATIALMSLSWTCNLFKVRARLQIAKGASSGPFKT